MDTTSADPDQGAIRVETELALHESEERFRAAREHSGIGLGILSPEGRWLSVNPALCRITGFTAEQLGSMTLSDLSHPADRTQVARLIGGECDSYEVERRHVRTDGQVVWTTVYGTVARQPDGSPKYFIVQVVDVTESRRSQRLLDTFFETSPDLLAVADAEGRLTKLNPAWSVDLGHDPADLLGRPLMEFVHPDDVAATARWHQALVTDAEQEGRFRNRWRQLDGNYRWLEWNSAAILDLGVVISNVRDVTEQQEHADLLAEQRLELERSNAELESFAYVVSHDLSEPLRVINGFLELLREEFPETIPPTAEQYVLYIHDGARRMRQLIDDLLTYSRVGRLDGEVEDVSLDDVVAEVHDLFERELAETGGTITVGPLPSVPMRRAQAVQLLQNLVGNALKFHRPDIRPEVRVHVQQTALGNVLTVDDNGIGIDPRHRDRVFKIFQRLHTREEYDGTGVGLAICQKIVDGYHGRIAVTESPLGGARFTATLPTGNPTQHPSRRQEDPS